MDNDDQQLAWEKEKEEMILLINKQTIEIELILFCQL